MLIGIKFKNIKVDGDTIIDGHHRYLAIILAGIDINIDPSMSTSATEVTDWNKDELVDEDWDTKAKIEMLNKEDAKFNDIEIERITEIIK